MRIENLRKTHKTNIIATWLCTVALSVLSLLQNGLTHPFFATVGVMLATSIIVTVLWRIPFSEEGKGAAIVCCIGLATLLCSVLQGGSDRNFLASFFVLGLAMLYFNSHIILSYGAVYLVACIIATFIDPSYIDGVDHERARVLIKLVIYAGLTILLYCATRKGEQMLRKSEEDAKIMAQAAEDRLTMSQNLNVIVESSNAAMEELSAGADSIAAATHDMSMRFKGTTNLAEQLHGQMQQVTEHMAQSHAQMETLTTSFREVDAQISADLSNAQQAGMAMERANDSITTAAQAAQDLLRDIGAIQKQMQQIESIATQTNLISVNASIEAARAGTAGRSFSEVAKQVTELATNSAQVAQSIGKTIEQLSATSKQVYNCVNEGCTSVGTSREQLTQMRQSMEELSRLSKQMDAVVDRQQEMLNRTDSALSQMEGEVDQVAGNARKNTTQVEGIAASIEEQSVSTREISSQLQEVAALSAQSAQG